MRCVVIGGLGFIGQAIVRNLLARGDDVTVIDQGVKHKHSVPSNSPFGDRVRYLPGAIERLHFADWSISDLKGTEEIYLMAGVLGTSELDDNSSRVRQAIDINIRGAVDVFEYASLLKARVFYPSKPNPPGWLNTYTITKVAGEQFARLYNERGKCRISSLRFFNIFGEGQKIFPVRKMLPVFALQAMHGLPIQVYGDGAQTVDLLYVEDAAELAVRVTRAGITEVMDAGHVEGSVVAMAGDINRYFGNAAGIEHLPMRDGETPGTKLTSDLLTIRRLFPDFEFSTFGVSMQKTLDWYAARPRAELDAALEFYGWEPCKNAS